MLLVSHRLRSFLLTSIVLFALLLVVPLSRGSLFGGQTHMVQLADARDRDLAVGMVRTG